MKAIPISLIDLIDDETEFSIIITVSTFKSLNLKQMSALMDIPESTLLRKLKDLIKYEVLVLDNRATMERRGKYYCLSDKVQFMMDTQNSKNLKLEMDEIDEVQDVLRKARVIFLSISGINNQLAKITSKFLDVMPEMVFKVKEKQTILGASHRILNFNSTEQIKEFDQIYTDFIQKIKKFEKQNNTPQKYEHTFYSFSWPIGLINTTDFLYRLKEKPKKV